MTTVIAMPAGIYTTANPSSSAAPNAPPPPPDGTPYLVPRFGDMTLLWSLFGHGWEKVVMVLVLLLLLGEVMR